MVLTEDRVTDAVCRHLVADKWKIISRAMGRKHGTDIVATRNGTRLEIEAKGAGSSDSRTKRYGQEFSQAQVFTHVGEAVLKALRVVATGRAQAAIALPDSRNHRSQVEPIRVALRRLGIIVFWVREDGTVSAEEATST
jgi:hypothetical protein